MSTCNRCGQTHDKCSAHNRAGKPCGRRPLKGQKVCQLHGGKAPQSLRAGERRLELEKAQRKFGLPREIAPDQALLEEVHRTAGHVAYLQTKVQQLDEAALVWGTTEIKDKTGGDDWGHTQVEKAQPSIWYELYARERLHLTNVCKAALAAGVEERRVRLAEAQGQVLASVIQKILADLDLSPEQSRRAPQVASKHLRLVASGQP